MKVHTPHVSPEKILREFTFRAIAFGCILSLIFGIGNAYLGLKAGITVSASVPAAVLSMAILRTFFKKVTILENNLVQTIASVGEGLAAGVIFTAPALFILGNPPSIFQISLLSILGAILGVLMMIPMRRYLIVEEHGKLPFPEGVACATILKSGESGRNKAALPLLGIAIGAVYKFCSTGIGLWKELAIWEIPKPFRTEISFDCSPALLGVGTIIGLRISTILFVGGILGWWVIIPLISQFATGQTPIFPGMIPISQMTPNQIWSNYLRYIGAGTIGIGGLISLFSIFPLIKKAIQVGFRELLTKGHKEALPRTERDISMRWLILGTLSIILFLWIFPGLPLNFITILVLTVIGFLFVAVTSITVGLVGSTSNPVSGMTITTLLITCVIFLSLGWTEKIYLISALTMTIVVNITIALAATTSQDLKTGFLLGATPKFQQIGEIIGCILPAACIGGLLYLLSNTYGFGSRQLPAPQGTLMALIATGIIDGNIPFGLILIGIVLGIIVKLLGLPILPFAMGLYLPFALSTSIMLGGLVSWLICRPKKKTKKETAIERGTLTASGLIAGDACTGVAIALFSALGIVTPSIPFFDSSLISLGIFLLIGWGIVWLSLKKGSIR